MRNNFFIRRLIAEYPTRFAVIPNVRLPAVARNAASLQLLFSFSNKPRVSTAELRRLFSEL